MSSVKWTNTQLDALCKENKIKGYSKLKKDDKVAKLKEAGIDLTLSEPAKPKKSGEKAKPAKAKDADEESKEPPKRASKPRVEKIDKKLVKAIDLNNYTEFLTDHKEDLTYFEVIELLKEDIEAFVKEADNDECADFVDKFGALIAISYQRSHKNSKLSSKEDAEIYKILLIDLFLHKEDVLKVLYKAVVKLHAKLQKPPVEKKPKKAESNKKVKIVEAPNDDSDEDGKGSDSEEIEFERDDDDEVEEDDVGKQPYVDSEDEL
jgi:hypothetical protein